MPFTKALAVKKLLPEKTKGSSDELISIDFRSPSHRMVVGKGHSGLNENTNGLLRQYWPKITDLKKISQQEVSSVIVQQNNRPRKTLSYQKPSTLMANLMAVLAA